MTISCEKEISINVKAGNNILYWTMDQAGASLPDSNLGVPLTVINCGLVAGIINNARQFNAGGGFVGCQLDADLTPAAAPQLGSYTQQGVTHDFWVKLESGSGGFPCPVVATLMDGNDGHQYQFDLRLGLGGAINNPTFGIIQDPSLLGPTVVSVVIPITWTLGQWYHLTLVYDQVTGKLTVYINGINAATSAGSFSLPTGTWNAILLDGVLLYPTIDLDEYMVCIAAALNANQALSLDNCGKGVTWPTSGGIVSQPLVGPPTCCLQCDAAFLAAIQVAFPGDSWNGKLLSSVGYQFTSNLGNKFVIFSTGTNWRFEVQNPGTVYRADASVITSPRTGLYTATLNAIPGAPGTVTFSAC